MAHRGYRPPSHKPSESRGALDVWAKRMARAEAATRVVCFILGAALLLAAVALFIVVIRLGPRALWGAVIGAAVLAGPAYYLLRRAITGRDVDRGELDSIADQGARIRWWL